MGFLWWQFPQWGVQLEYLFVHATSICIAESQCCLLEEAWQATQAIHQGINLTTLHKACCEADYSWQCILTHCMSLLDLSDSLLPECTQKQFQGHQILYGECTPRPSCVPCFCTQTHVRDGEAGMWARWLPHTFDWTIMRHTACFSPV